VLSLTHLQEPSQDDLYHLGAGAIFLRSYGINASNDLGRQSERDRLSLAA
jgi:hypothetical protein